MKKHLLLLALLAFTINVKASEWDFTIAEGEDIDLEHVIAISSGFDDPDWAGYYILSGQTARVYLDNLPNDTESRATVYLDRWGGPDDPHYYQRQSTMTPREFMGYFRSGHIFAYDNETGDYNWDDFCIDRPYELEVDENGEYYSVDDLSSYNGMTRFLPYTNPDDDQKGETVAAMNRLKVGQVLLDSAAVPLNDVRITITNSEGNVVNSFVTNALVNIQGLLRQLNSSLGNLTYLENIYNSLGFSGEGSDNLESFLAQWRTTDGINQGSIITNLTNIVDWEGYLQLLIAYEGSTNDTRNFQNYIRSQYTGSSAVLQRIIGKGANRRLLFGDWYDFVSDKLGATIRSSEWQSSEDALSQLMMWDLIRYYFDTAMQLRQASFETNVVSSLDLGRDWLNLATNDLNSFTYWLNQHTFTQSGTNDVSAAQQKFDAITNQYAQISLVGANASNTAQNWDYFKRLEMLLAAIVYKQTDLSKIGEADDDNGTELANDNTVSAAVSSAEQDVSTSLSAVASSLSLTGLESSKNNLVSLWQIAVGAFDTPGTKPQITIFEQDEVGGDNNSSGAVNLDFSQGAIGDFCDFCHHLFGFLWSFGSLFIFWKVAKYCWDMGYRVVRFHYSLCRKFLGI